MRTSRLLLVIPFSLAQSCAPASAVDVAAKDWQIKSLKGIETLKYAVAYDPGSTITKVVTQALSGLKKPVLKAVTLNEDEATKLSKNEARLVVVVDSREKDQCWVGVSIKQRSQLERNPAIFYDSETYKIGSLCPKAKSTDVVKDLCATFIKDLSTQDK